MISKNKAGHQTIIDNRNFSFSKSLFTFIAEITKNIFSYSLCFSGRIWRTRQERVLHRRLGFALQIWCKETRTAVDKQVPPLSKDHERTFCFPVDKKDQQCSNNDSSFQYEGQMPFFSQVELPLDQFRMVIFFSFRFPPSLPFTSHAIHKQTPPKLVPTLFYTAIRIKWKEIAHTTVTINCVKLFHFKILHK